MTFNYRERLHEVQECLWDGEIPVDLSRMVNQCTYIHEKQRYDIKHRSANMNSRYVRISFVDGHYLIEYNQSDRPAIQRFSVAFGFAFILAGFLKPLSSQVCSWSSFEFLNEDPEEQELALFAAGILAPATITRKLLPSARSVAELALALGIPTNHLIAWLKELRLV